LLLPQLHCTEPLSAQDQSRSWEAPIVRVYSFVMDGEVCSPNTVHAECFRCGECHKQLDYRSKLELVFFHDSDKQRITYHKQCVPHFRLKVTP
jgi:hypothetical protein